MIAMTQPQATYTANLTIHFDQPGAAINRDIYGQFAEHLGRCIYEGIWVGEDSPIPNTRGIRNDVVAALKARHPDADTADSMSRGLQYLLTHKDRYATWYSTQATQNVLEALVEMWDGLIGDILDKRVTRWVFPFATTFFIFIVISNLMDLVPGVDDE